MVEIPVRKDARLLNWKSVAFVCRFVYLFQRSGTMNAVVFFKLYLYFFLLLKLTQAIPAMNNNVSTNLYSCIPQSPPDEDQVPVARYEDCIRAILFWANIPGRNKPTTFSDDPSKGYKVPHAVVLDQCEFVIDLVRSTGTASSSFAEVAQEAGVLAKDCVLKAPHTGGIAVVGRGRNLEIILHGRTSRATPSLIDE